MKRKNSDLAPLSKWAGRWADYNLYQRYGIFWRIVKCYKKLKQYLVKLRKDFLVNFVNVNQKKEEDLKKMKESQKSLKRWTQQKWRTKSGKKSGKTGERYLPEAAIKALSPQEYAATTKAKRKGTKQGKQFVKQPKSIAKKVRKYR